MNTASRLVLASSKSALRQTRTITSTAKAASSSILSSQTKHESSAARRDEVTGERAASSDAFNKGTFTKYLAPSRPFPSGQTSKFTTEAAYNVSTNYNPFDAGVVIPSAQDFSLKQAASEIRVPFLPDNYSPYRPPQPEPIVSKPVIYTVAPTSTHIAAPSALTELLDNNAIRVSFHDLPEFSAEASESTEDAMLRNIFSDVLKH
ncbi:hypothetical protein BJ508DRAFT_417864 [Ascobolus immersus RN42]|uniref:Uncharacterized protein n=1 Tax=Ascobolus immersus RN42 TaxID=1160509 RepID=A0A3N4HRC6_ASCIM|nr:hypothetical protein BJ508DRAFT_417864 [Ascobolus immersus RN42]